MKRHGGMCQCRSCARWRRVCAENAARNRRSTVWVAECEHCYGAGGTGTLVQTFDTRQDRDRWAVGHASRHGHGVHLRQRPAEPRVEYDSLPSPGSDEYGDLF